MFHAKFQVPSCPTNLPHDHFKNIYPNFCKSEEQQTPPRRIDIFENQLSQLKAGSMKMIYVNFHVFTCPGDFPGVIFLETLKPEFLLNRSIFF